MLMANRKRKNSCSDEEIDAEKVDPASMAEEQSGKFLICLMIHYRNHFERIFAQNRN